MPRTEVRLNIYDIIWLNDFSLKFGVGVFHTGIEVYGKEYSYGGHPYKSSGIFEAFPQEAADEFDREIKFRQSILLGETRYTENDIRVLMVSLGREYSGDRYHLLKNNCNHFSTVLAKTLTGAEIPNWVNRIANITRAIPFWNRLVPHEWLTPTTFQRPGSNPASPPSSEEISPARSESFYRRKIPILQLSMVN